MKLDVPQVIARARKALKLTQTDVAKRMGITKAAVSGWETGDSAPSRDHVVKLSRILKIPVEQLF